MKKAFILLIGKFPSHLDHNAPLAIELDIPLVITELSIYNLAKKYYPKANIIHAQLIHLFSHFIPNYDILISCMQPKILKGIFPKHKSLQFYWMPHGSSDKGAVVEGIFKTLENEENLLVYGDNLKNLICNNTEVNANSFLFFKNYRYYHFLKNKAFYLEKLKGLNIKTSKPILLYAPSWKDQENTSSFYSCQNLLIKMKKNYQIICKWHPFLLWQEPEKLKQIENTYTDIFFLKEYPLIYSLLSITDIYVGDMSSIGYDFLTFEKPMVFLNEHGEDLPLFSCGETLIKDSYTQIESAIENSILNHKEKYLPVQKKMYEYTFGKKESLEEFDLFFQNFKEQLLTKEKSSC